MLLLENVSYVHQVVHHVIHLDYKIVEVVNYHIIGSNQQEHAPHHALMELIKKQELPTIYVQHVLVVKHAKMKIIVILVILILT